MKLFKGNLLTLLANNNRLTRSQSLLWLLSLLKLLLILPLVQNPPPRCQNRLPPKCRPLQSLKHQSLNRPSLRATKFRPLQLLLNLLLLQILPPSRP